MNLSENKIEEIRKKRKWKKMADTLHYKEIENELDEGDNIFDEIKKGDTKFDKKLKRRFDEFGTEFTAFNMKDEMQEGQFDESGYYTFKNRGEEYDPWYDSVKEEIKKKEQDKMREMIQKKRDRLIEKKKIIEKETEKDSSKGSKEENKPINFNEEESENSKSSKSEDEKDFQYYGDEDLYYKEEKLEKKELEEIKDKIKNLRIKLVKFFGSEKETVNDVIKRLKPKAAPQKKGINVRKNKITNLDNDKNNVEANLSLEDKNKDNNEEKFKELLDLISQLTELSHFDVYYDSYNKILRDYGEKPLITWMYRLVQENGDNLNEYGEFSTNQIKEWNSNKFFEDSDKLKFEFQIIKKDFQNPSGDDYIRTEWFDKDDPYFKRYIIYSK